MKTLKWLLISIVTVVVLAVVVSVAFLASLDLNDYKQEIQTAVYNQTGRDLTIDGELSLTMFPWFGITMGETNLSNAPGFSAPQFASLSGINLKVEVLPLLRGDIRLGVVELNGLMLNLQTALDGSNNWSDLNQTGTETAVSSSTGTDSDTQAAMDEVTARLSVGGVNVQSAQLIWDDQAAGQKITLEDLSILSGELSADAEAISLSALQIGMTAIGDLIPAGKQRVEISGDLRAYTMLKTAAIGPILVTLGGQTLGLEASVRDFDTDMQLDGRLFAEAVNLQQLLTSLLIDLPEMAEPAALSQFSFDLPIHYEADNVVIANANLGLDGSEINLNANLRDFEKPRIEVSMKINRFNADNYLPAAIEQQATTPEPAVPGAATAASEELLIELPTQMLRDLNLDASLNIEQLTIKKLQIETIKFDVQASNGLIEIKPLQARLYEGTLQSVASLDVQADAPVYTSRVTVVGVQAGPLLKDFMDDDFIHGSSKVEMNVRTSGHSIATLKAGLNGSLYFLFENGAVKSFNLAQELRKAEAKYKRRAFTETETQETDFSALSVSGTIVNGVLFTDDLNVQAPVIRASGAGEVNLIKDELDYLATITIVESKEGQGGKSASKLRGVPIPIRLKGPFNDLDYDWQFDEMAKAKLAKKLAAQKAKLKAKQAAAEADAKRQADAAVDAQKKKIADELKDKLKKKLKLP